MKNIVKFAAVLLLGASSCHFTLAAEEGSNEVVPQLTVAQQLKEVPQLKEPPQLTVKPQFKAPEQRAGKNNSLAEQAARYNQRLQAISNADAAALCEQLLAAHSNANRNVNLDNTGKEKLLKQMAGRNCDEYAAELLQREKNASRQLHRRSVDRNKLKTKQQSRAASRVGGDYQLEDFTWHDNNQPISDNRSSFDFVARLCLNRAACRLAYCWCARQQCPE